MSHDQERSEAYERDLARLKAHLQPSIEQAKRGEAKPLDVDALLARVHRRIAQESAEK